MRPRLELDGLRLEHIRSVSSGLSLQTAYRVGLVYLWSSYREEGLVFWRYNNARRITRNTNRQGPLREINEPK
jgi:hypothetical protein